DATKSHASTLFKARSCSTPNEHLRAPRRCDCSWWAFAFSRITDPRCGLVADKNLGTTCDDNSSHMWLRAIEHRADLWITHACCRLPANEDIHASHHWPDSTKMHCQISKTGGGHASACTRR